MQHRDKRVKWPQERLLSLWVLLQVLCRQVECFASQQTDESAYLKMHTAAFGSLVVISLI